jgi:hypothetical protein
MKELFGRGKLKKDGTEGRVMAMPDVLELQLNDTSRCNDLVEGLSKLKKYCVMQGQVDRVLGAGCCSYLACVSIIEGKITAEEVEGVARETRIAVLVFLAARVPVYKKCASQTAITRHFQDEKHMMEMYELYLVPFGELLTDIERIGIHVEMNLLRNVTKKATQDFEQKMREFRDWVKTVAGEDVAKYMNPTSTQQIATLLFGHYEGKKFKKDHRVFKMEKDQLEFESEKAEQIEENPFAGMTVVYVCNALRVCGHALRSGAKP